MKTLHLLRHAKSSWEQPEVTDLQRGLNKRGRRDAPRMGAALAARLAPQAIHVSPARRAQLTLEGLCSGWPALGDFSHICEEALYTFEADELFHWLAGRPDEETSLFVIAHNPALTDLVNALVGHHCLDNLPTAGYAGLCLPISRWCDLPRCAAVLEYSLFPKILKNP